MTMQQRLFKVESQALSRENRTIRHVITRKVIYHEECLVAWRQSLKTSINR